MPSTNALNPLGVIPAKAGLHGSPRPTVPHALDAGSRPA